MVELSRYVVKTQNEGQDVLFDTVQKRFLPIGTSDEDLEHYGFLAGQEDKTIRHYLFDKNPDYLILNICPTWLCNLRCGHCVVLNRLVKQEPKGLDVDLIVEFIRTHVERYNTPRIVLRFAGGEPLLVGDTICKLFECIGSLKIKAEYSMTTNLAMELSDVELRALRYMDDIGVSLDGLESTHNKQRKSCDGIGGNLFLQTVNNIKKLMLLGMRDKIHVQAAVKDEYAHEITNYYHLMIKLGVLPRRISFGCIHPTENKAEATAGFKELFRKNHFFPRPCCKYQFMCNFSIDPTDSVFSDYYSFVRVGSLTDAMEKIEEAAREIITSQISVLNDPGCIKCPVVGYCWGGCSQGEFFWKGSPSQHCNQERIMMRVAEMAKNGKLIGTKGEEDE